MEAYAPLDDAGKKAKRNVLRLYRGFELDLEQPVADVLSEVGEYLSGEETKSNAVEGKPTPYREDIVKDNYSDFNDKFYGNNDVMVSKAAALHGTHVSGIIGAARGNGLGMDGVADNVKIMMVRAVPDGDEHDKDIALAIRYAVDNGAKVVNMSFGKGYSPEKKWVDDAVKYAESKSVLLVHAAGNSAENIDTAWNFPLLFLKMKKGPATGSRLAPAHPMPILKQAVLLPVFLTMVKKKWMCLLPV
ncbi:MAG: S8 family serine peptidase [Bacteroidota bacterium]